MINKEFDVIKEGEDNSRNIENNKIESQPRETIEEKYYYLDNERNVYDSNGNMIKGINPNCIVIDENNNLWYMEQKVGIYGGTLDELARNIQNTQEKNNTRTLKLENNRGFGQIMIVSLVLLCLGLFVAVIILSLLA